MIWKVCNIEDSQFGNFKILKGHTGAVTSVIFSYDEYLLVSGSTDKTVKLWNVEKQEIIQTFLGHSDVITSVAINISKKIVISGSYDKTIKIWGIQ